MMYPQSEKKMTQAEQAMTLYPPLSVEEEKRVPGRISDVVRDKDISYWDKADYKENVHKHMQNMDRIRFEAVPGYLGITSIVGGVDFGMYHAFIQGIGLNNVITTWLLGPLEMLASTAVGVIVTVLGGAAIQDLINGNGYIRKYHHKRSNNKKRTAREIAWNIVQEKEGYKRGQHVSEDTFEIMQTPKFQKHLANYRISLGRAALKAKKDLEQKQENQRKFDENARLSAEKSAQTQKIREEILNVI